MRTLTKVILITAIIFFILPHSALSQNSGWFWQNPYPQGNPLQSVSFVSAEVGYVVGEAGTIIKTTDGGISWSILNSHFQDHLFDVYFANEVLGWAVGWDNNILGIIFKTTDGGNSWTQYDTVLSERLQSIFFVNELLGWAVGRDSKILQSL